VITGLGMLNQMQPLTGTERFELELGMRLLQRPAHDTWRVYTRGGVEAPRDGARVEVVPCPPLGRRRGGRLWSEQVTWARELWRRPPDLLVTLAFSPPWTSRVPSLVTVHDVAPLERPGDYTTLSRFYWQRAFEHAKRATRLATPSEWVKQECARRLGIPLERIDVVHNGVRPVFFASDASATAASVLGRLGVSHPFWFHCGTVQPRKNLDVLVRSLALLRSRGLEVPHLVNAGVATAHAAHLLRLAASLGVGDRVTLAGPLGDAELAALYRTCDAFVYPSWSEGFGVPPVEAMAGGAVVIAARASCLPEILGDAPHWADPFQPETWIAAWDAARAENEPARRERVQRGAAWAARYTWEASAERMAAAIDQARREIA
jgi:glycosyltransferase involved in cell wall biosynthesis